MDVGHLRKARSGSAFLAHGTGDVRIKILGDQGEDVDIDDGDTDTAPYIDAPLAGATGGGTGVGTGAKSMAGSTLAPRVGVANVVSSTSSHGRREPHTAGSQASIGRQTLPQLTAGEDGSPKYSDGSVPKVSTEGTSKRVHANDFRIRFSETSGRVRRPSSVQTLSKRKALETGPSTSTPTKRKRAKLHGNSCDSSAIVRKNSKTEEVQPRETALRTRQEDLPLKRKEIIKDKVGEGSAKCPRASEMVREKRPRMLVLGDESDEDMLERDVTALPCDSPDREQLQENTDPVNFQQWLSSLSSSMHSDSTLPVTSTEVDTALPSDIPAREQLQENTVSSPSHQSEVARSAHGSLRNDHAPNQNAGSERNRSDDSAMLAVEKFPAYLSRICCMLDFPGPAKVRAGEIFKYFLRSQKQIRKSRPHHEIFAIQLCVVWMAAEQFNHAIDKAMSICLVEERLCVSYTNRDQLVGELYKTVKKICNKFTPRPAPLVNVPTTSQPALVPEITPRRTSVLNHPPIAGFEPSPGNVLPQAIYAAEPARNQLEGSQGTGLQVETEVLSPESQSVQETLPGDNALEADGAQAVVEPVGVEVRTEVVLVEADPRLVPEEPLDMLISQSRVPEYEPIQVLAGTITSGDSSLEQGLGWVLVSPAPESANAVTLEMPQTVIYLSDSEY